MNQTSDPTMNALQSLEEVPTTTQPSKTLTDYVSAILIEEIENSAEGTLLFEYNFVYEFLEAVNKVEHDPMFEGCLWDLVAQDEAFRETVNNIASAFGYLYHTGRVPNDKIEEMIIEELDTLIASKEMVW